MFERFTNRARRVLVLAEEEARLLEHNFLGTEHLLLGLLREGEGVAAVALGQLGVSLDDARWRVKEAVGPSCSPLVGGKPFTPRAKKVLELSLREALQLGHQYISTEHMLLGIVREGEGVAAQVLVSLGADLSRVRDQVFQILSGYSPPPSSESEDVRARTEDPRCGRCDASLSRSARYRFLDVPPADPEPGRGPLRAAVMYCAHCGTVLGPYVETAGGGFPRLITGSVQISSAGSSLASSAGQNVVVAPRARFPDDPLDAPDLEEVPEDARVELVYRDGEVVEGTAGSKEVRLTGRVKSHQGSLKGTWGEDSVNANWRLGDNSQTPSSVPALLTGHFGEQAVELKGDFHLSPNYFFEQADVAGVFGETAFRAAVSAADGGLGSTDAIVAEGTAGAAPFEPFATRAADRTRAVVRGSFDGQAVSLDASGGRPSGTVKLFGSFSGTPVLLILIIGVVAYFL